MIEPFKRKTIAVDLDGTLCVRDRSTRFDPYTILAPVQPMVERVKQWIAEGHTVIVFTARMARESDRFRVSKLIGDWTEEVVGTRLEATALKLVSFSEFYDDKAYHVEENTGIIL